MTPVDVSPTESHPFEYLVGSILSDAPAHVAPLKSLQRMSLRWMSLQQKDVHLSTLLIVFPVTEYTVMLFIPYCRVASLCCSLALQYFETPPNVFQSVCIVCATLRPFFFLFNKKTTTTT